MAKVTIVVPLYNKGKLVGRALRSALEQSFQDFHIIVVNDGSTDDGAKIALKAGEGRVRLITQANQGPGAARNRGVAASDSPYIAFLDADDELLPNYLERSIDNLEVSGCGLSACASFRGSAKEFYALPPEVKPGSYQLPPDVKSESITLILRSMHGSEFIRRDVFDRLGGFFECRALRGEDSYLWVQVLLNYPVYYESEALMWYHTEAAELNQDKTDSSSEEWKQLRRSRPISPVISHPEHLRQTCSSSHRDLLERFLAYEAVSEALTRTSVGDFTTAGKLAEEFPHMREYRFQYGKLRAKLASPELAGVFASIARRLRGTAAKSLR